MSRAEPNDELAHWLASQREIAMLLAHDLRNPLAAVLANLNYLELALSADDKDAHEALADVKVSTETLLRMIDNFVAIARLEAPRSEDADEPTPVDLGSAVTGAQGRCSSVLAGAGVTLTVDVPPGEHMIRGEATLVEQLVENLLANSAQHVRRGHRARLAVTDEPAHVTLALDDDGPPFGPVERDFGRDGQLEMKKRSAARYSRGLALYVVGLVARSMGAEISVRDDDGKGHVRIRFARAGA